MRYFAVIGRWCTLTFFVFAITLWTGNYITENLLTKTYTATAEMQISLLGVFDLGKARLEPAPSSFKYEIGIIESQELLLPIIHDLGLGKAWAKRIYKSDKEELSDREALAYLSKILKIELIRGTNFVKVTASSEDPKEAADIANAIADRYKARRDSDEQELTDRSLNSLRDQIAEQGKVAADDKSALEKMKKSSSSSYADAQKNLQDQQSILDVLNIRLKQDESDAQHMQSPVRIISRAMVPENPSSPDKVICFFIALGVAALISVVAGCFIEVILLFVRAAEGDHS